ncbi:MAG TPA: ATP-binding protein [Burkholderiales bacterium]|nr:ATP-binding protein [Burkholderiales bacterium]
MRAAKRSAKSNERRRSSRRLPDRVQAPVRSWPSEAEQTLEALRAGLIDALVIPAGQRDSIYALKTFEEVEQANSQLRESQERLLLLLSERERLMQDLHDGCIQSIYAVGLALEDCRSLIAEDPHRAAGKVAQAAASLNLVIQELRAFISGLRPVTLLDFPREVGRIIESFGMRGPRFQIDIEPAATRMLSPDKAEQLLQITREALSNVVRHAKARSGRISLRRTAGKVRLEVADNGQGFDKNADKGRGLGLHHIAARVEKLGGQLRLDAKPAKGCRIVVEIAA